MVSVSSILDKAQRYLHDDTEALWTRAELLEYLNHGQMRLLTETEAIRRLVAYNIPSRVNMSFTHPWESQYGDPSSRSWTFGTQHILLGPLRCTYAWEVEHNDGATPTNSANAATQQWERILFGNLETRDRYAYPEDMLSPYRIAYNEQRISATSTTELDRYSGAWQTETGQPTWYSRGLGRQAEFEVWPDASAYTQAYECQGMEGTLREVSGDRTYSVIEDGYGTIRSLRGERQYVCESLDNPGGPCFGIPRLWEGSDSAILVDYSASAHELTEEDSITLLPDAFGKYLRYYVIARALGRVGEGNNPTLAAHYEQKWSLGVTLLKRIATMTAIARMHQNKTVDTTNTRTSRPRLPGAYPRTR